MKTVREIYSEYDIMPNLQMHQLRVAAVAKIICDHFKGKLDSDNVVLACLFHDMGNIIKSDLNYFPDFLKPHGLEFWQKVKDRYIGKYGTEEHMATEMIAKELHLPEGAMVCLKHTGFSNAEKNEASASFEDKICNYSDMRVGPHGVISMEERMAEGRKRYEGRTHTIASNLDRFNAMANALRSVEKQIFAKADIRPGDITDEKVKAIIEELKDLKI